MDKCTVTEIRDEHGEDAKGGSELLKALKAAPLREEENPGLMTCGGSVLRQAQDEFPLSRQ
jgi:hypothetical protein